MLWKPVQYIAVVTGDAKLMPFTVIFCTQFEPGDWYGRIGTESDATVTEAIIDRIIHNYD